MLWPFVLLLMVYFNTLSVCVLPITALLLPLGRHSTNSDLYEFKRWSIFSRWPPWGDLCVGIPAQLLLVTINIIVQYSYRLNEIHTEIEGFKRRFNIAL